MPWQFKYDGEGKRVQTIAPDGKSTYFIYDAFGELVAEYPDVAPTLLCTTCFLSLDHLGTTRMVTDKSGNIVSRHDFTPYGQELISGFAGRGNLWGAADQVAQKFTGAEQDNPDLSFFQARHYLATHGRFNSPDPVNFGADILNPQSWNGYTYVLNSPLSNVDPDGLQTCNACYTNPGSSDGAGPGGAGISLGFSFSFGGGGQKGLSPTPKGVRLPSPSSVFMEPGVLNYSGPTVGWGSQKGMNLAGGCPLGSCHTLDGTFASFRGPRVNTLQYALLAFGEFFSVGMLKSPSATVERDFFAGTKYSDKVLAQMKQGDFHAFPEGVKAFQSAGQRTTITGGDKVVREMLEIPGEYKGKQGMFQFIKEADGSINHRLFRPNRGQ